MGEHCITGTLRFFDQLILSEAGQVANITLVKWRSVTPRLLIGDRIYIGKFWVKL